MDNSPEPAVSEVNNPELAKIARRAFLETISSFHTAATSSTPSSSAPVRAAPPPAAAAVSGFAARIAARARASTTPAAPSSAQDASRTAARSQPQTQSSQPSYAPKKPSEAMGGAAAVVPSWDTVHQTHAALEDAAWAFTARGGGHGVSARDRDRARKDFRSAARKKAIGRS